MHCPIVVLILQCIVAQYCDLHTRDRYTAEAGLEDAGTAWCWAVCDPTSEVWSCWLQCTAQSGPDHWPPHSVVSTHLSTP